MENTQTTNAAFSHEIADGQRFILNVNQALDFSSGMDHFLLCPDQSQDHGIVIDNIPKYLDYYKQSTHSIILPKQNI